MLRTIIRGLDQRKTFGSYHRDDKSREEVPDRGLELPDPPVTTGSELRANRGSKLRSVKLTVVSIVISDRGSQSRFRWRAT